MRSITTIPITEAHSTIVNDVDLLNDKIKELEAKDIEMNRSLTYIKRKVKKGMWVHRKKSNKNIYKRWKCS